MFRDVVVTLGFTALKAGVTVPNFPLMTRFCEHAYFRDLIKRLRINCILDVGANKGQYARNLRRMGYDGFIFSFEPIRRDFEILSGLAHGDPRWKPLNFALGSENASKDFNIGGNTVYSSFLSPINDLQVETKRIEIKRLDAILANLIDDIQAPRIFLKVDTQGYDLEVVKGAGSHLRQFVGLQSEISVTPIYKNMPHYTSALEYYESLGFALMNLFVVNRTSHRSILEYDCIMARLEELDA